VKNDRTRERGREGGRAGGDELQKLKFGLIILSNVDTLQKVLIKDYLMNMKK